MATIRRTRQASRSEEACSWLQSYLFRPGGAYAIAICRVALFGYLYLHVIGDATSVIGDGAGYLSRSNLSAYYPKSIVWLLFPKNPPSALVIDITLVVAKISTAMALAGLLTRPAMIASSLSCLFLGALMFSWEPLWSHPYNSGLIAALAFMFGRAGDRLSVDSLIARYVLRRPISIDRLVYWWPVILGQFGVATVYFGGFYAKWSTPSFTYNLDWVFSDNLRNSVVLPWLIRGEQLPWNVDLISGNPWIWKLSAFAHLATQALPILALASLNRPWIRLLEGSVFAAGVVLLKLIMGMWNPSWIILTAFFVDWEYFLRKMGVSMPVHGADCSSQNEGSKWVLCYCGALFLANMAVILTRFDDTGYNRAYPLSSMGFYSSIFAQKPYSEHKHFPFTYGEILLNQPDGSSQKWFCAPGISSAYLATHALNEDSARRTEQQAGALRSLIATAEAGGPRVTDCVGSVDFGAATSIDLFSSILHIPAFPEQPRFDVGYRALVARFEKDQGRLIAASSQLYVAGGKMHLKVSSRGFEEVRYEMLLANDPWKNASIGPLIPFAGQWSETVFTPDPASYARLATGSYAVVVRCIEPSGRTYDFFGGILYR